MLKELSLRNYLLLEDLHLEFPPGFSVITGETGSGKSVLLEGLRIVLGQSVSKDELRDPNEKAYFELIYEDQDEILALSREIFPSGRSISRINGEIVNLNKVRDVFAHRIDFYGQRDDSLLLHRKNQQELIFEFCGSEIDSFMEAFKAHDQLDRELEQKQEELKDLSPLEREALEAQYRELEELAIDLQEDQALEEGFDEIIHSKEILEKLEVSSHLIEEQILSNFYRLQDNIEGLSYFSKREELSKKLDSLAFELEDLREEIQDSLYKIDIDEGLLLEKENRYIELQDIKKRFQRDLEELVAYKNELEAVLDRDIRQDEIRQELEAKRASNLKAYHRKSKELLVVVEKNFKKLSKQLVDALGFLELSQAEFGLDIETRDEEKIHHQGHYSFGILASMNRGKLRPMANILSGGEMSRLMLALKSISKSREVMVFDEIDTGISGRVAHQVAKQIKLLSRESQVLAISHLPQVVAFADQHYFLEKNQGRTQVRMLYSDEHVEKLAHMMSAQVNEASLETARKMIKRAQGEEI